MTDYILTKQNARTICSLYEQFACDLTSSELRQALSSLQITPRDVSKKAIKLSQLGQGSDDVVVLRLNPCDECDQELLACSHILQTVLDCDGYDITSIVSNFSPIANTFDFYATHEPAHVSFDGYDPELEKMKATCISASGKEVSFNYEFTRRSGGFKLICRGAVTIDVPEMTVVIDSQSESCEISCDGNIFGFTATTSAASGFIVDFSDENPVDTSNDQGLITINDIDAPTFNSVSFRTVLENRTCC